MNKGGSKKSKTSICRNGAKDFLGGRSNLINDLEVGSLARDIIENFKCWANFRGFCLFFTVIREH